MWIIEQPLNTGELIGLIIQAVGLIALVLSLWFLAVQTRQVAKQTSFNAMQTEQVAKQTSLSVAEAAYGRMAVIDDMFVQFPEMYPYFYGGVSVDSTMPEYTRAMTIAMAMTNYLESSLPSESAAPMPWWDKYLDDQFALSPLLCEYLESRNEWFNPDLVAIMRKARKSSGPSIAST